MMKKDFCVLFTGRCTCLLSLFTWLFLCPLTTAAQHPVTFMTKGDAAFVKSNVNKYPLLKTSYEEIKAGVDSSVGKDVDVPFPKDPAGGYTHERHKANYMLMFNSGLMYNFTGEEKYATLVKKLLLKYADLNPQLKNHPQATSSSPGHIFWQALNDANWLVYTGMAYDLIYPSLNASEKQKIENGAFKPEVDFFTHDLKNWFNLVHNHGVWACAGVGIVGLATDNKEYVNMALRGTGKDGVGGFLAQLDGLFSPDGYYTEGPYYVRYAILPFYLFANALNHAQPALKIFEYRDKILKKALLAGLQQTNLNGSFLPINDALKEKDYTSNELVSAAGIAWEVFGKDDGLLFVAKKQDRVLLNRGGASIAAAIGTTKTFPAYYPYKSVEFTDGAKGDEGGVSLLRSGQGKDLTTLIYKYASHGLSHGHFDELTYNLFDQGNEILQDYGSVRFIGIEQKYGGRYLPENTAYASQTIAHNTIVVDEKSNFNGEERTAEKYHSEKLFSDISNPAMQVVVAKETNAYPGVQLQRSVYLLRLPGEKKLLVDIFNANAPGNHQYDLPFQFNGSVINTSFKYTAATKKQEALGKKNGYQFLWKEAEADVKDTLVQFTFLNDRTYYTISSLVQDSAKLFFTRVGANDPNFNLRREPSFIIRKNGSRQSFVNVVEIHGKFDPGREISTGSYPSVKQISVLQNDEEYTIASVMVDNATLTIVQCNKDFNKQHQHNIVVPGWNTTWIGPCVVLYNGQPLK